MVRAAILLCLCAQGAAFSLHQGGRRGVHLLEMQQRQQVSPFFPFSSTSGVSRGGMRERSTQLYVNNEEGAENKGARQLLGLKGASKETNIWKIRLQLCKPVTWIPLIWGVACGAAASGNYHTWNPFGAGDVPASLIIEDALKAFSCMLLSGPILTGGSDSKDSRKSTPAH